MFGGISFIGFLLSFAIRGESLEAEGWDEEEGSEDQDTEAEEQNEGSGLF